MFHGHTPSVVLWTALESTVRVSVHGTDIGYVVVFTELFSFNNIYLWQCLLVIFMSPWTTELISASQVSTITHFVIIAFLKAMYIVFPSCTRHQHPSVTVLQEPVSRLEVHIAVLYAMPDLQCFKWLLSFRTLAKEPKNLYFDPSG
jgi:hypothetical protein